MRPYNISKKLGAFLTAACLCLSVTEIPSIATETSQSAETSVSLTANSEGVIEISTAEEFLAFAESCVLDSNSEGKR